MTLAGLTPETVDALARSARAVLAALQRIERDTADPGAAGGGPGRAALTAGPRLEAARPPGG